MRDDVPALLPLICPRCRTRSDRGRDLYTLSTDRVFRQSPAHDLIEATLRCDNPACAATYPIVDGIPLLSPDLAAFLANQLPHVLEGDLTPDTAALLAAAGPDDAPYARLLEHLSIYLDAHWGDRADPPPPDPLISPSIGLPNDSRDPFGMRALADRIAARAAFPIEHAIDLGCSCGRATAELARGARFTTGIDLHLGALRRARRLLAGQILPYNRRNSGRNYTVVQTSAGPLATPNITFLCADILDPPLAPHSFDRVCLLNVFDSVRDPPLLLSVADGLCAPGGELIFACPYAFQSDIVDEQARASIDQTHPDQWVKNRLLQGTSLESSYTIEDEAHLPWTLRRDARSTHHYQVHYLRARKSPLK